MPFCRSQSPTHVLPHPFPDSGSENSPEIGIFASRPLPPLSLTLCRAALHFQRYPSCPWAVDPHATAHGLQSRRPYGNAAAIISRYCSVVSTLPPGPLGTSHVTSASRLHLPASAVRSRPVLLPSLTLRQGRCSARSVPNDPADSQPWRAMGKPTVRLSEAEWEQHRPVIERLYSREERTQKDVEKYMAEVHNFCAT